MIKTWSFDHFPVLSSAPVSFHVELIYNYSRLELTRLQDK